MKAAAAAGAGTGNNLLGVIPGSRGSGGTGGTHHHKDERKRSLRSNNRQHCEFSDAKHRHEAIRTDSYFSLTDYLAAHLDEMTIAMQDQVNHILQAPRRWEAKINKRRSPSMVPGGKTFSVASLPTLPSIVTTGGECEDESDSSLVLSAEVRRSRIEEEPEGIDNLPGCSMQGKSFRDFEMTDTSSLESKNRNGVLSCRDSQDSSASTAIADDRTTTKQQFELFDVWRWDHEIRRIISKTKSCKTAKLRNLKFTFQLNEKSQEVISGENLNMYALFMSLQVMHPNNKLRSAWDILSLCLVVFDVIFIPLMLLELPESTFRDVVSWITRLFWTFDMGLSLCTGFVHGDGNVERSLRAVWRRYAITWFPLDILVVGIDWFDAFFNLIAGKESGLGYAKLGKAARIMRMMRLLRLLRILKCRETLGAIVERLQSEFLVIALDLVKLSCSVLAFAHVIACLWYTVGIDSEVPNWVQMNDLRDASLSLKYLLSLHWSLSQFTGGMDEIRPYNVWERFYAVCVFLFAFLVSSVVISSLTSSMTRLQIVTGHHVQAFAKLRRFLRKHKASGALVVRVIRNARSTLQEQQDNLTEANVDLLNIVSEPLLIDLHFEMFSPILTLHNFFLRYTEECPHVMRKVCHKAAFIMQSSAGDTIFEVGEIPAEPRMYFLASGRMQYVCMNGGEWTLEAIDWISEPVLWTSWMHLGVLTAISDVRLVVIDSNAFTEIVAHFHHTEYDPRTYTEDFIMNLNFQLGRSEITDLSMKCLMSGAKIQKQESTANLTEVQPRISHFLKMATWAEEEK